MPVLTAFLFFDTLMLPKRFFKYIPGSAKSEYNQIYLTQMCIRDRHETTQIFPDESHEKWQIIQKPRRGIYKHRATGELRYRNCDITVRSECMLLWLTVKWLAYSMQYRRFRRLAFFSLNCIRLSLYIFKCNLNKCLIKVVVSVTVYIVQHDDVFDRRNSIIDSLDKKLQEIFIKK